MAGQTIHVQAPDGRLNAIVIPPGMTAGSTFTVEFAPAEAVPSSSPYTSQAESKYSEPAPPTQGYAPPPPPSTTTGGDDGFASGFGNSGYHPPTASAIPSHQVQGNYPTTKATLY